MNIIVKFQKTTILIQEAQAGKVRATPSNIIKIKLPNYYYYTRIVLQHIVQNHEYVTVFETRSMLSEYLRTNSLF